MLLNSVLVIDTETTGPNPFVHDLVSLALVPYDSSLPRLNVFVALDHDVVWTEFAQRNYMSFQEEWAAAAVPTSVAAELVQDYINALPCPKPCILAGHNVGFDRAFMMKLAFKSQLKEFSGISHRNLDTFSMIFPHVVTGSVPPDALTSSGAFSYFDIDVADAARHTAMGDAEATRELIRKILVAHARDEHA